MKRPNKYIVSLVVLFAIAVVVQLTAPPPISWQDSFTREDRIPFGAYILYELLPELFPAAEVKVASVPAYNMLGDTLYSDASYVVINSSFAADDLDAEELLTFADDGNTVFIAAADITGPLADSLGFETYQGMDLFEDTVGINLANPALHARSPYFYKKHLIRSYFTLFDTLRSTVLGTNTLGEVNFIRVPHGEGVFYLSTVPHAFSNYNLVDERNAPYAFDALSYLPSKGTLIWDEYYKDGRREIRTPLRYILSQEALRWAYYLVMAGVLLFIIFMGRRRQRIIPEIKPLPNTTLEFAETVGQLYYQHGDHKNIAEKKITYFLEYVRSRFGVNTNERDGGFYHAISARSGVDVDAVKSTFGYIDSILQRERIDEESLVALNRAIERFHGISRKAGPSGGGRASGVQRIAVPGAGEPAPAPNRMDHERNRTDRNSNLNG